MKLQDVIRTSYKEAERDVSAALSLVWEKLKLDKARCTGMPQKAVHMLLKEAIRMRLYAVDKSYNDAVRGVEHGRWSDDGERWKENVRPARKVQVDVLSEAVTVGLLKGWKIHGKALADMTGKEVAEHYEREWSYELVHQRNRMFLEWLVQQVPDERVVAECVQDREAREQWEIIQKRCAAEEIEAV